MGKETGIAWTDHTFNIAWGCQKISPGCANCYAELLDGKLNAEDPHWGPRRPRKTFGERYWRQPFSWAKLPPFEDRPRLVFTSSMCDVFEDHPTIETERAKLWPLIRATPGLHYQLLTKRAERARTCLPGNWPLENVWLGVSIENRDYAWRADAIRNIPAVVRFISYEPALGPLAGINLRGIDWVIFGGESGPGYRGADLQWARDMRQQCLDEGVTFFFKQSAAPRTEMGIELDGEVVRRYPLPRYDRIGGARGQRDLFA